MTPGQFKGNDSYSGPLGEYLKTPSGIALSQMLLQTDAALNLPPEIEALLKSMDVMQMLAFNHACLIGWRAAVRFVTDMSRPVTKAAESKEAYSDNPEVRRWDEEIAANRERIEKLKASETSTTP